MNNHVIKLVRFQALMATNMRTAVFWDVAPCSLVDTDQRFRGAYCLHHQGDGVYGWSRNFLFWNLKALKRYHKNLPSNFKTQTSKTHFTIFTNNFFILNFVPCILVNDVFPSESMPRFSFLRCQIKIVLPPDISYP
jgi:hypothetical protein